MFLAEVKEIEERNREANDIRIYFGCKPLWLCTILVPKRDDLDIEKDISLQLCEKSWV
jgi:hypothetical protein